MAEKARSRLGVRLSTLLLLVALAGVLTWGVRQSFELRRARQEREAWGARADAASAAAAKAQAAADLAWSKMALLRLELQASKKTEEAQAIKAESDRLALTAEKRILEQQLRKAQEAAAARAVGK